jgi:uncharacterized membrane protein required for colicin V production
MMLAAAQASGETASQIATKAVETPMPPAPDGFGWADGFVVAAILWGLIRGYQHGFTGEMWSVLGGIVILIVPFFGYHFLGTLLKPLYAGIVTEPWVNWIAFLGLTFLLLLIYELIREKYLGRIQLFIRSGIESAGGAIGGAVRMMFFALWLMLVIFLMPQQTQGHYWVGYKSLTGHWVLQRLPNIEPMVRPSYYAALKELEEFKQGLKPKQIDPATGERIRPK